MLVLLVLLTIPQAVVSERHLAQTPEAHLKMALALEAVLQWARDCLDLELDGVLRAPNISGWRTLLGGVVGALYRDPGPAVLVAGGIHLKAVEMLVNGTEELRPRAIGRVVQASISSLISAGLPYSVIEEAVVSPSTGSLIRLLAYTSRVRGSSACLEEVVFKAVSFVMSIEKGYVERARAIAEEVAKTRSLFFGLLMFSVLERAPRGRVVRPPGQEDISDEAIERLITILRSQNISIVDILARYSVAELMELYERLTGVAEIDTLLSGASRSADNVSPPGWGARGAESDDDVIRQSFVLAGTHGGGAGEPTGGPMLEGNAAGVGDRRVAELVSRIQDRAIAAVFDAVNKASFGGYLCGGFRRGGTTPTYTSMGREGSPDWWTVLAIFAIAASIGGLYQLAAHGSPVGLGYTKGVPREGTRGETPGGLDPVVKLFWEVVGRLATSSRVEVRSSDTHREIVEKLCPYVDDVASAGLRRLGKLYEVVRYAKAPHTDLLSKDLERLKRVLGA